MSCDLTWSPSSYPTLLAAPAPRLFVYPKETVVSKKFEGVVSLGIANTRMKDFYDLEVLSPGSRLEVKFSRKQSAKPLRIAGPSCLKQALRSLSGGILLIAAIATYPPLLWQTSIRPSEHHESFLAL
jgi:hypothetical protein